MHDRDGKPLKVGDKVTLECTISETYATDEYCNVQLKTVEPFFPDMSRHETLTMNAKMIVKVD